MKRFLPVLLLLLPGLALGQDRLPMRGDAIGVNTGIGPNYYGRSYALADLSRTMTAWTQTPWSGPQVECSYDKTGGLILDTSLQPPQAWVRCYDGSQDYPLGTYVCTWDGDGDFNLEVGPPDWTGPKWGGTSGRAEVPVTIRHSQGWGIKVNCTRSNPDDRVRNFHFWAPGTEGQKSYFRPEFLRSLKGFSTLRTIKDNGAEASRVVKWSDRAKLGDTRWTGENGLPYEVQIALCNEVGADWYVNVPYWASDDLVRKLARQTGRDLSKGRKVYAEWSNEIWNWGYPGSQDASARYAPGTDATTGNFFGFTTWGPYRARQVHAIWEEEFAGADRARLVTVIGGMFGWPDVSAQIMAWAKGMAGGGKPCDALAVAPYFDVSADFVKGLPDLKAKPLADQLDALFADLTAVVDGPYRSQCVSHRKIADANGVALISYEFGPHLVPGPDEATQALYLAANRDTRMGDLLKRALDVCFDSGFERVNPFQDVCVPTQFGYFGLRESGEASLQASPKNRARIEYQFDTSRPITPDVLRLPAPAGPPKVPDTVPTPPAIKPAA